MTIATCPTVRARSGCSRDRRQLPALHLTANGTPYHRPTSDNRPLSEVGRRHGRPLRGTGTRAPSGMSILEYAPSRARTTTRRRRQRSGRRHPDRGAGCTRSRRRRGSRSRVDDEATLGRAVRWRAAHVSAGRRRRRVRRVGGRFASRGWSGPGSRSAPLRNESGWACTYGPVSSPLPPHTPHSKTPRRPEPAHP